MTFPFSSAEPMQAGVPPCSLQRSTQRKSEVERSGGTLKQVALAGAEGVQPVGAGGRCGSEEESGGRQHASTDAHPSPTTIQPEPELVLVLQYSLQRAIGGKEARATLRYVIKGDSEPLGLVSRLACGRITP